MIKIASRNVNGLRALIKKGNLLEYLKKENPDIICLQEIKAKQNQIDKGFIKILNDLGYKHIFFNSAERGGYSGTAIFSKKKPIRYIKGFEVIPEEFIWKIFEKYKKRVKKTEVKDVILKDKEGRLIFAEFPNFFIGSVYVPNAKVDLSRLDFRQFWDEVLLEYIKYLSNKKSLVLCGDMNVAHQPIDLRYPKANEGKHGYTKEEREGFSKFLHNGFIDSFRYLYPDRIQYSWWSMRTNARKNNSGWRIDYCLISPDLKDKIVDAFIHDKVLGSDHAPVGIILDM